jgi:hypothetical protein
MDLGFDTVGNATIILHDRRPILATDPWFDAPAYFGSWSLSHAIPDAQREALEAVEYVWLSHGHPDHLNMGSLPKFRDKKILLPDHYGSRIKNDLEQQGFKVSVLRDREWVRLSDRVRVQCLADNNQDAVLLCEMGKENLLVNLNDAAPDVAGWGQYIRKTASGYPVSFLFRATGYGDADMINFFTEEGVRIPPTAAKKRPVGPQIKALAESYGATFFVPSSSMHRYQRTDSNWANEYTTPIDAYANGFRSSRTRLLPAYIRYDLLRKEYSELNPAPEAGILVDPKEFGDDWAEPLSREEKDRATKYFQAVEHLASAMDFIRLKIGGEETVVPLRSRNFNKGITFEAPRHSFMSAIDWQVFDDLLIGNFMKVTLNGKWPESGLYPDFTPYVAKYADNGGAKTKEQLDEYFAHYRRQIPRALRTLFRNKAMYVFQSVVPRNSEIYELGKKSYYYFMR